MTAPTADDETLVRGFRNGDEKAASVLFERHAPWVFNFAFRMLHDEEGARDACQESFLRAFSGLGAFRFECAFRTWLYRVAFNAILAQRKLPGELYHEEVASGERKPDDPRSWIVEEYPDERSLTPDLLLALREIRIRCILGMLLCMDRRHRAAFILRYALGLSHRDVALVLEEREENVRQMISRSNAKLSAFMAENCGCFNPDAVCQCRRTKEFAARLRGRAGLSEAIRLAVVKGNPRPLRAIAEAAAASFSELKEDLAAREFAKQPFIPFPGLETEAARLIGSPAFRRLLDQD